MTQKDMSVSSGKPPSEAPMPVDPAQEPAVPESPQPKDPSSAPVPPEVPQPDAPMEEPDPFDDGNFPV